MGMFDTIKCYYPLPIEGINTTEFQTKDTPSQMCDLYEIRKDGSLWHQTYDVEDKSPRKKWIDSNPGKPEPEWTLLDFCGCMSRVNLDWEPCCITKEIRFYDVTDNGELIEFSANFVKGILTSIKIREN